VLHLSRGNLYYLPRPVSAVDLAIMDRIDKLHLEFPFAGSIPGRDHFKPHEGPDESSLTEGICSYIVPR
jgi:hypothetical protein